MKILVQPLLIIIRFLCWHIDCFQRITAIEKLFINFSNALGKCNSFKGSAIIERSWYFLQICSYNRGFKTLTTIKSTISNLSHRIRNENTSQTCFFESTSPNCSYRFRNYNASQFFATTKSVFFNYCCTFWDNPNTVFDFVFCHNCMQLPLHCEVVICCGYFFIFNFSKT